MANSFSPSPLSGSCRCFYEWKTLGSKKKQPYAFGLASGQPLAFAGLWNAWREPSGGWLISYVIIITEPNELTATVHNRMPFILKPNDYDRWLSRKETEQTHVDLLRPYDAEKYSPPGRPSRGKRQG